MTPFRLAFALLAARADAFPGSASDQQLLACSGGNCPAMHGQIPQLGNALNAAGKADGGTCATGRFEPREALNLPFARVAPPHRLAEPRLNFCPCVAINVA